jgi:hypothetical protein
MYHQYMISRAFIPPWSLAMRDRKLSDQTLPVQAAGTLVSPSERFYDLVAEKSRKSSTRQMGQHERRGMGAKGGRGWKHYTWITRGERRSIECLLGVVTSAHILRSDRHPRGSRFRSSAYCRIANGALGRRWPQPVGRPDPRDGSAHILCGLTEVRDRFLLLVFHDRPHSLC